MKNLFFGVLLFPLFLFPTKKENSKCVENINPDCFCIQIFDPVCGCNDVTYGNACMAACAGITKFKRGECKDKSKT